MMLSKGIFIIQMLTIPTSFTFARSSVYKTLFSGPQLITFNNLISIALADSQSVCLYTACAFSSSSKWVVPHQPVPWSVKPVLTD